MKLGELAQILSGTLLGDPNTEITGIAGIETAQIGDVTFLSSSKFLKHLRNTAASCVILKEPVQDFPTPQIIVPNPLYAFARAVEQLRPPEASQPGISHLASISPKAVIHSEATVHSFAVISEDVSVGSGTVIHSGVFVGKGTCIGENCTIYPNVTIREKVKIGSKVIIHPGTVVGSDGFGYVFEMGKHHKIPQVGGVIIEDEVEIGSNVTIDRAAIDNTIIGKGTKIDNLVQIAHNVKIGENSLIIAQVAIGGSSDIGDFVTIGGQAAISDHSSVESGTMIAGQSGLAGRIVKGIYAGSPAIPHKTWLRAQALYGKLPEMNKKIRELENRLTIIEKGISHDDRE